MSQPSWAAWIEIVCSTSRLSSITCRSPLGLRGFKYGYRAAQITINGRSPLGLRGFKCRPCTRCWPKLRSQPIRAAWI